MKTCIVIMQIRKHFYSTIFALAFCSSPSIGHAVQVTSVSAPNLLLPSDGILYPFDIDVSGKYTPGDIFHGGPHRLVDVKYWDEDFPFIFDNSIDLTGVLKLPLGGAAVGKPWGPVNVRLKVGCDLASKVFGPSGPTNEGPLMNDGYFHFSVGGNNFGSWGYNTVTCTTSPPPPPPPIPLLPLAPVPGPLPILGVGVVFRYTRMLRRKSKRLLLMSNQIHYDRVRTSPFT